MKYITLLILLFSTFGMAQFFEQDYAEEPENNPNQFFQDNSYDPYVEPEYETYKPGQPGDPVPLDDWAFILPLAGMAVGVYFIRRRKIVNA